MSNPSGITICDLPKYLKEGLLAGSGAMGGVLVERLAPTSEARTAGLMVGDVCVKANSKMLSSHRQAVSLMNDIFRNGQETVLNVLGGNVLYKLDKRQGKIGISCTHLLPTGEGTMVCKLHPSGLARAAGILVGSTILSVQGELARTHQLTIELIDEANPVVNVVCRDNVKEITIQQEDGVWGLTLRGSTYSMGAVVASVSGSSAAAAAGIQPQDLILSINGELLRNAEHAETLLEDSGPTLAIVKRS